MRTETEEVQLIPDFVILPSGVQVNLYNADDVRALNHGGSNDLLIETVDWCENFLGRSSSLVGRTGNVCPFVPEAMMRGSLKFAVIPLQKRGEAAMDEIAGVVTAFREHFLENEKAAGKMDIFGSWIMIYPDINAEEASHVIDVPQRGLKPSFVKEGLMLGEFHPISRSPGLRNPAFRPLRSPIPMLVIRHMVESDIDFLMRPFDPPKIRIQSLRAYLQFLGPSLSLASQVKAKQALKVALAEATPEDSHA
jgi:hypothetical protein